MNFCFIYREGFVFLAEFAIRKILNNGFLPVNSEIIDANFLWTHAIHVSKVVLDRLTQVQGDYTTPWMLRNGRGIIQIGPTKTAPSLINTIEMRVF